MLVSGGVASLPHTFTRGGSHVISAVFSGGLGTLGSSAAPVTVAVTPRRTSVPPPVERAR
ncbi:hypothetical protein GS582_35735 [Rhodococcus hoagii]|nr:hypothetical protein [Prescottella equi]